MAIKIQNSTIIDDSRNIVNAGVTTVTSVSIGNTQVISSARQLQNIASLDATTTATIESAIANAPNTFTDLNVTGISTFTNGPVLVGSGTSTGTASQRLQVTGGAYVSGSVGIGTTNPQDTLDVGLGTIRLYNKSSPTRFSQIYQDGALTFKNSAVGDDFQFLASSNSLMVLKGSGPLILPGTASLTGTASQLLQVTGGAYVSGNLGVGNTNGEGIKLFVSQGAPAANRPVALITDDGTIPTMTSGATLRISNDGSINSFSLLEAESSAGRLVFTNAGNLGIGTTNPGEKLQVDGNLRLGVSTTSNYIAFYGTTGDLPGSYNHTYIGERIWSTGTERSELFLFKGNDADAIGGQDRIRLAAGQIRIDTFPSGTFVGGASFESVATNSNIVNRVVVHSTGEVGIGTDVLTGTSNQALQVGSSTVVRGAYVSGSVGIGTTNPQASLEVVSTTAGGGIRVSATGTNSPGFRLINNDTGAFAQNLLSLGFGNGLQGSVPGDYCIRNSSGGGILLGISTALGITSPNQAIGYVRLTPSGELLVGTSSTITTGTANQRLQVSGGAYVSGSVGIGTTNPTSKLSVDGDGNFTGVVTASSFSGNASSATYATSSGISTFATTAGIATFADNAGISTNLKGGLVGNLVYQSATDTTVFLANGSSGTILQSNGVGNAPSWITAAPADAITGLTVRDEGTIVGGANSVSQFDFVGSNISVASTAGIATITIADNLVGTALSVSGITTTGTLNVGTGGTIITTTTGGLVGIGTTNPQSALDIRGAITIGVGTVGINSIFSTTAAPSWYYTNKSIPSGNTSPQGVYVGAAGTQMFVVGNTSDLITQYPLSVAYDVSTAGAATTFFITSTQETVPTGIDFHPDGTKMFVCGSGGVGIFTDAVHEYSLSTPWNVAPSSVGYTTSHYVGGQEGTPTGVVIGAAGTVMYVVGDTSDAVHQYTLTSAYSLAAGNVTYTSKTLVLSAAPLLETSPQDLTFNSTGTVLWVLGGTNDRIYEFRLGTAWDISTAVFYDDFYVGFNETNPLGLHVIPEQNVAYVCGSVSSGDSVFQYSTNTPAIEISSSGISSESSIILSNETRVKDRLYVKGNILTQGTLTVTGATTLSTTILSAGTLTVSSGNITAGNVAATLLSGNTNTNITLASGQTSGTLIVGGASQTGTITIDQSASGHILNIATGANASGVGKTVNIATGGASGSRTLITVGSATAGAISTVTIPSPTNLLIGTITPTGTASQQLQVNSGAYVSGNLGIGTTNPTSKLDIQGDATVFGVLQSQGFLSTGIATISVNSSSDALRINQLGSGNALVVEDSANPDATPFVVRGDGNTGIGTTNPVATLHLQNNTPLIRFTETDGATNNRNWNVGVNEQEFYWQALTDAGSGGGNLFKMTRSAEQIQTFEGRNSANTWFIANNNTQRVGIGTSIASAVLDVRGNPWFSPNTTGVKATALRLGRFVDGANAAFDIITDDNTGDDIEIRSNRFSGKLRFSRSSPSGIQTTFILDSNYLTGTSISIADTTGTTTKIKIDEAGNTYFNNSGAVLVGTISSTGTASQLLQVTGGAYVSGNLGIGTTNPTSKLSVVGDGNFTGVVTATSFSGDGSQLTGISASGSVSISTNTTNSNLLIPYATSFGSTTGLGATSLLVYNPSSGNLGIGTTNPTSKLDVLGNAIIKTTSTGDVNLRLQRSSSSGRAQFTLESESGSQIWRVGLTGGGTETFSFFDGTQNALQLIESLQVVSIDAPYSLAVGAATTTGTASQRLQVTGGAYVSGSVGIGTTNPTSKLSVVGDGNFTGVVTATTFVGALTGTATTTTNIPNLTGAITSNNTTTSLGSFTSAQLATALTDETGSGANVFATSPTLVTPILGSASATDINVSGVVTATSFSGSGTNLTGIVTSIVAGTNITISGSTGQVTINSTGGGGGGAAPALDILEVMLFA